MEHDGDAARMEWVGLCRACAHADVRAGAAQEAAFWDARVLARPEDGEERESARRVAVNLRRRFAALGAEPDEATAEFIARYAA